MDKDHEFYFGAKLNNLADPETGLQADDFFIMQGGFNLFASQIAYHYSTWASVQAFETWKKPLQEFRKIYSKTSAEFEAFKAQSSEFAGVSLNHAQIIGGIIETGRALCNAPADAEFVHCLISAESFNLHIEFTLGGENYICSRTGATYNQTIIDNPQIVQGAALMGHTLAVSTEPDFWMNAEWILPTT